MAASSPGDSPHRIAADTTAYVVVEEMPRPIGGLEGIQERVRYPELARRAGIEGIVFIQLVVDEQGDVSELYCTRHPGGGTCEASLEAVRATQFLPGRQRGQPVKVRLSLPIRFSLTDDAPRTVPAAPPARPEPEPHHIEDDVVAELAVSGLFPNPTVGRATIAFSLPEAAEVGLEVFDVSGRRVLQVEPRTFDAAAEHQLEFNVAGLASGTYIYRLRGGQDQVTGRVTVVGLSRAVRAMDLTRSGEHVSNEEKR